GHSLHFGTSKNRQTTIKITLGTDHSPGCLRIRLNNVFSIPGPRQTRVALYGEQSDHGKELESPLLNTVHDLVFTKSACPVDLSKSE
ncbi:MAG: hypothetical protein L0287_17515, partial [Anaerolineae bacterium]|nr:hypothetical protein [Anaerolineae bacterium]